MQQASRKPGHDRETAVYLGRQALAGSASPRVLVDRDVLNDLVEHVRAAEDLNDELVQLQQENAQRSSLDRLARLSTALKLSPSEASVCLILFDAAGLLSKQAIYDHHFMHGPQLSDLREADGNVHWVLTYVCKIRHKLGHGVIEHVWRIGYRLSAIGRATIAAALVGEQ